MKEPWHAPSSSSHLNALHNLLLIVVAPGKRQAVGLSGVACISSTGVGALTATLISARKRGASIVFRRIPPKVSSILEILGIAAFFPTEDDDG